MTVNKNHATIKTHKARRAKLDKKLAAYSCDGGGRSGSDRCERD